MNRLNNINNLFLFILKKNDVYYSVLIAVFFYLYFLGINQLKSLSTFNKQNI